MDRRVVMRVVIIGTPSRIAESIDSKQQAN